MRPTPRACYDVVQLAKEYQELVREVQEIEANSTKVDFNTIDMSSISSITIEARRPAFSGMLDNAMAMEETVLAAQQLAKKGAQPARTLIQMQSTTKYQQATTVTPSVQVQVVQKPPEPPPVQKPPEKIEEPKQAARKELSKFADNLNLKEDQKINTSDVKPEPEEDLVLPSLSVSDQIAELERIIEGIKEHVFDREHMEIIKKEVYGLSHRVSKMKASSTEVSSMQEPLTILRDMRIEAVKTLLSESNV